MTTNSPEMTPKAALLQTRIIWGAMLLGQIIFLVVVLYTLNLTQNPTTGNLARTLAFISLGMVVAMTPVAYLVRGIIYGPARAEGRVEPKKYSTGNNVFFGMLEGPSMLGIVSIMLGAPLGIAAAAVGLAIAILAMNFPTGSAMSMDRI